MRLRDKSAYYAFKARGLKGLIVHLTSRLFGDAHFLRPASSVDFKLTGMSSFQNLEDFLSWMLPKANIDEIARVLKEANAFLDENNSKSQLEFPDRWNSGRNLQLLLYSFVRLTKVSTVVETGTANGASALAIAGALHQNELGTLFTFDIEHSGAPLVPNHLRNKINFIHTNGTQEFIINFMKEKISTSGPSLFLHDADHSYLGQIRDYETARYLNFDFIFSDDVDTSMAFCDFAGKSAGVFYDSPKFIGALITNDSIR